MDQDSSLYRLHSTNSTMNWIEYDVDRRVVFITGKNKRWISLILLRGCVCGALNSRRSSTQGDDEISVPSAGASEMQDMPWQLNFYAPVTVSYLLLLSLRFHS